jgi:hypothetical protein
VEGGDHIDPDNNAVIRTHRAAVAASEGVKQVAVAAAGNSQSAVNAAFVSHYRNCRASALAQGQGQLAGFYQDALRQLGTGGV